ncbi:bifunctional protein FolD protein [Clostridiales bacterium]|nr:bifunctional protein FolD protein [Clostridiales bacterium]
MSIIKGATVADAIDDDVRRQVKELTEKGIRPRISIVRVGEDKSQISYERGAKKRLEADGIECDRVVLDRDILQADFENEFDKINSNKAVHGIMILQPLPSQLSIDGIKQKINPLKDIDAMSPMNLYKVMAGDKSGYAPCTAESVIEILDWIGTEYRGKKCAVVGCSLIVGRPLGLLLLAREATVTFCHEFTVDTAKETRDADILVVAAGVPDLITEKNVNAHMTVIDVGINVDNNGKLCGDVAFDLVAPIVKNITPVPAGVGAVTTSVLAKHVVKAAKALEAIV